MRYHVVFEGQAAAEADGSKAPDADQLEAFLDRTMGQLMGSHAEDATVGGAMARGTFEVSMTVEADTPQDAIDTGSRAISSAMQAAGGFVPGWSPEWITARANRISKGARARS